MPLMSPALAAGVLTASATWEAWVVLFNADNTDSHVCHECARCNRPSFLFVACVILPGSLFSEQGPTWNLCEPVFTSWWG